MTTADTNQVDYWEIPADKDEAWAAGRAHTEENRENTLNQEDYQRSEAQEN